MVVCLPAAQIPAARWIAGEGVSRGNRESLYDSALFCYPRTCGAMDRLILNGPPRGGCYFIPA